MIRQDASRAKTDSWSIPMTRHTLLAGLATIATLALTADFAEAGHCCCASGYSIGDCSTPTATVYSGGTALRTTTHYYSVPHSYTAPRTGYYYSPSSFYYRSYSPYNYYRPYRSSGISISIGSGYRHGYSYGPSYRPSYGYSRFGHGPSYGYPSRYGVGRRSGFGFSFGSSIGRRSHFHRH